MNIQTRGIASLENCLKSNFLTYEFTGKHYPQNITSMEILGVPMTTTTWDCEDFEILTGFITECIEDGMNLKES